MPSWAKSILFGTTLNIVNPGLFEILIEVILLDYRNDKVKRNNCLFDVW